MCSPVVCLDDLLHKAVAHNVFFGKIALGNALDLLQHMQRIHKAAAGAFRQVDLSYIPVTTTLEPTPMRVRNIFICSGVVFCASSRMMKESSSVRPRI